MFYNKNKEGDFPEDAYLENGNYLCTCRKCGKPFTGYKRRKICKKCLLPEAETEQTTKSNPISDINIASIKAFDYFNSIPFSEAIKYVVQTPKQEDSAPASYFCNGFKAGVEYQKKLMINQSE